MNILPVSLFEWARLAAVALIVAGLSFTAGRCDGVRDERARQELRIGQANVRFMKQKAIADELAAERRLTDTIAVNEQERNLRDAIDDTPDTVPDAVRIRLGCERLRSAGGNDADLPSVCRSGG